MSHATTNKRWVLVKRPEGDINPETDLRLEEVPIPDLTDGQFLVHNIFLSLDPTNRIWMSDAPQYLPVLPLGSVMRGISIGRVLASKNAEFAVGDFVSGMFGWQTHAISNTATKLDVNKLQVPLDCFMSLISFIGFSAYFGLGLVEPKAGETVVVDAAAGAVGSLVGQIAKIKGARVVGIAGGDDKCQLLRELGFDAAINYKKENVGEALRQHCPNGIDVLFENVGGEIFDEILLQMNLNGRISLCGLISTYNDLEPTGPKQFAQILMKRLTIKGFIVLDFAPRFGEAVVDFAKWYKEGKIRYISDVIDEPIEQAPYVVKKLFNGEHKSGKLIQLLTHDYDNQVKLFQ